MFWINEQMWVENIYKYVILLIDLLNLKWHTCDFPRNEKNKDTNFMYQQWGHAQNEAFRSVQQVLLISAGILWYPIMYDC